MRGLKPGRASQTPLYAVASFTDAWIETVVAAVNTGTARVASFTDAWIETKGSNPKGIINVSRIFYRCVD